MTYQNHGWYIVENGPKPKTREHNTPIAAAVVHRSFAEVQAAADSLYL